MSTLFLELLHAVFAVLMFFCAIWSGALIERGDQSIWRILSLLIVGIFFGIENSICARIAKKSFTKERDPNA